MADRPIIDYPNLPYLSREGIYTSNNNYATRSLFLETAREDMKPDALWTLAETEVFAHDRWFPSAWMAYIHATDEYDALRKICGNVRQWEHIKAMFEKTGRTHTLDAWVAEQVYLQKSKLRHTLTIGALSGGPGYTAAAKMLLAILDGPAKRGRPKTEKPKDDEKEAAVSEDAARILQFQR